MEQQEETLHRLLFGSLSPDEFIKTWADEISDPEQELCIASYSWKLPKYGRSQVYVFASRMAAVENSRGKWSAFATKAYCEEKDYFAAWARFCRGTWTHKTPQIEGVFPTRDLEGARGRDRTLVRKNGRLVDVTVGGGFVGYGQVSEWRGDWFEFPYPPLRGAS